MKLINIFVVLSIKKKKVPGIPVPNKRIDENLMEVIELKKSQDQSLTAEDLLLLVDLFYLPYSHGIKAKQILTEFKWLKNNAIKEESEEFKELTEEEQTVKVCICILFAKQFVLPNVNISVCEIHQLSDFPQLWHKVISLMLECLTAKFL
jgi:hypothetical protein